MTIIFLDVDGVLTSTRCNGFHDFDLWAVNFIRWACRKSDAQIVMSSVWRNNPDAFEVFTTTFGEHLHTDWRTGNHGERQDEIDEWLSRHPEITEFIVIDDDIGDLRRHEARLIKTSSNNGMLFEHMDKLRDMLKITTWPHGYAPVFRDDVCFFTEREKEAMERYPCDPKFLDD